MSEDSIHQPWLGRVLTITTSGDTSLVGRSGLVIAETRNTLTIQEDGRDIVLGKSSIKFQLDGSDSTIDGSLVCQRAEDRIHRRFRRSDKNA